MKNRIGLAWMLWMESYRCEPLLGGNRVSDVIRAYILIASQLGIVIRSTSNQ